MLIQTFIFSFLIVELTIKDCPRILDTPCILSWLRC